MKVEDRHGKKYILSPTHKEAVADLLADVGPLSYKQLPLLTSFCLSNKYRDEPRPKHGLLRSREFSMLDAYGAHASPECAKETYDRVTNCSRLWSCRFTEVRRWSHVICNRERTTHMN
ncbi:unnamed protein product [Parnassius mnemosyne]|uniref:Aminoacyl-tRNA synthetase class II (G/ P/ S/T) domain-containing protein n=1 Tax=Parnassius mnemosyne TaxID=213953 RepID=A0AAV1LSZ4_9NEOP